MTSYRVKLSHLAERDLIGIWHLIADHDAANATKFLHVLDVRISSLNDFPDRVLPGLSLGAVSGF